jgi:hypothetical protein
VVFGDDDDAGVAEGEAAAAVLFEVVADHCVFGDDDAFVDYVLAFVTIVS